jgi:hypothetical protein
MKSEAGVFESSEQEQLRAFIEKFGPEGQPHSRGSVCRPKTDADRQ